MKATLAALAIALLTLAAHASPLSPSPDSPAVPAVEVEAHQNATLDDIHLTARQTSFPVSLLTFTGFQCGGSQRTIDLSTAQHNQCINTIGFNSYRLFQANGILPPFQVRVGRGCLSMQNIPSVNTCTNVARAAGPFSNYQLSP